MTFYFFAQFLGLLKLTEMLFGSLFSNPKEVQNGASPNGTFSHPKLNVYKFKSLCKS